jgi:hypothetical protein
MLLKRIENSAQEHGHGALKAYYMATTIRSHFIGQAAQLLVCSKDQDPIIYGWRDGLKFKATLISYDKSKFKRSPHRRVTNLVVIHRGIVAYVAWTNDGEIIRINKDGTTKSYHREVRIEHVLAHADHKHVILLGRKHNSPATSSLHVWRIKVEEIDAQAILTEIGSFDNLGSHIIHHGEVLPGSFLRPYHVRLWTSESGGFEGYFS